MPTSVLSGWISDIALSMRQRDVCETLGLQFRRAFQHQDGGPDTILTRPDCHTLRKIVGDGNVCLDHYLTL